MTPVLLSIEARLLLRGLGLLDSKLIEVIPHMTQDRATSTLLLSHPGWQTRRWISSFYSGSPPSDISEAYVVSHVEQSDCVPAHNRNLYLSVCLIDDSRRNCGDDVGYL